VPVPDARLGGDAVDSATGASPLSSSAPVPRPTDPDADEALVGAWVDRGEPTAFARLVTRHQTYVFRLALSVLGPGYEGDAQDVAQDVFIRVAGHLQDFRGESTFRTWLRRLALNLALDRRRRARWRKPHVDAAILDQRPADAGADDPFTSAEAAERARVVRACLDVLPDAVRSVVHLHYWLDLSVDEIAATLHVPAGTVKSHLHRGRKLLSHAMTVKGLSHV
jgi:RNA polymerase sigma-70 factor (ECF subfamily)